MEKITDIVCIIIGIATIFVSIFTMIMCFKQEHDKLTQNNSNMQTLRKDTDTVFKECKEEES